MFNKKFREVAKKEINRWLPKTTLRLVQSKSRKTNAGPNANPTSNRVKNDRATTPDMSRTEMTHIPKNSGQIVKIFSNIKKTAKNQATNF